jgi:TRAP-type mannitol/chloroaromatic compound transport system permease small subunit
VDAVLRALLPASRVIDNFNERIGRWVSWLILAAVIVSAANAIIRKIFDASSNAWLELQWVLFGIVFLLCAPWTLMSNEHIRIDIVNSMMPQSVRNWIDVIGHTLFLLPLCIIMMITGLPFFRASFRINEQSFSAGGLPQWPAKSLLLIGFTLLFLQGLSELVKRIAVMRGIIPDPYASEGGLHAAAEAEVQRLLAEAEVQRLLDQTKPEAR